MRGRSLEKHLAVVLALIAGCATPPKRGPDPSFSRPAPRRFHTLAVLPFGGDPAVSRPAEELVQLRLREQAQTGVQPPFQVGRALAQGAAEGRLGEERVRGLVGWIARFGAGEPRGGDDRELGEAARRVGAWIGADAILVGVADRSGLWNRTQVPCEGADARLLLVDAETGLPVALVVRSADRGAACRGFHEAAMNASSAAADAMLGVLAAKPGEAAAVRAPERRAGPSQEGDPP